MEKHEENIELLGHAMLLGYAMACPYRRNINQYWSFVLYLLKFSTFDPNIANDFHKIHSIG